MTAPPLDFLRGTLELLILKAVSAAPLHGYAIAEWVKRVSDGEFLVEEGSLYPALQRLRKKGWLTAEWGVSDTGRRARFYTLTAAGRERLTSRIEAWDRYTAAVRRAMSADAPS